MRDLNISVIFINCPAGFLDLKTIEIGRGMPARALYSNKKQDDSVDCLKSDIEHK